MSSYAKRLKKKIESGDGRELAPNPLADGFEEKYLHPEMSDKMPATLEEIEGQINKLQGRMWEVAWLIGKRLIYVRDNFIKKLKDYDNIGQYVESKFDNLSQRTAYQFMFITANFSKEESVKFGSKLALLQPLEEERRILYLDWLGKENPSYQEIQEKLKSDKKPVGRPKEDFSKSKTRFSVNLQMMDKKIPRSKRKEFRELRDDITEKFKKELEELVSEFSQL